jgi:hypothetical protein
LVEASAPAYLGFFPLADPPMGALLPGLFFPNFYFLFLYVSGGQGTACICLFCFFDFSPLLDRVSGLGCQHFWILLRVVGGGRRSAVGLAKVSHCFVVSPVRFRFCLYAFF